MAIGALHPFAYKSYIDRNHYLNGIKDKGERKIEEINIHIDKLHLYNHRDASDLMMEMLDVDSLEYLLSILKKQT
jgi:hypothetical protein